jgi:hypothetical protein
MTGGRAILRTYRDFTRRPIPRPCREMRRPWNGLAVSRDLSVCVLTPTGGPRGARSTKP